MLSARHGKKTVINLGTFSNLRYCADYIYEGGKALWGTGVVKNGAVGSEAQTGSVQIEGKSSSVDTIASFWRLLPKGNMLQVLLKFEETSTEVESSGRLVVQNWWGHVYISVSKSVHAEFVLEGGGGKRR